MKKTIYTLFGIFVFLSGIHAQIGIQTESPLQIFHVDPKKDTNSTGTIGYTDDVVIDNDGQLGLGIINPTAKLDIRGTFRLRDGNQADGRVLITDNNGIAEWGDRPKIEVIEVDNINLLLAGKTFTTKPSYSNISITIPEGTWQVMFQVTCTASNNMYWDLCTSPTSYSITDIANRRAMSSATNPVSVTAIYFVTNTKATTYYIWASTRVGTATYLASGTLWALPVG